jgi:phospholipase/lecithinase/hemolysin
VFLDQADRLCAVARLGNDLDVACVLQELADALSHQYMVVGQQDSDSIAHGLSFSSEDENSVGSQRPLPQQVDAFLPYAVDQIVRPEPAGR